MVIGDLKKLKATVAPVTKFVNGTVAHIDSREMKDTTTLSKLSAAIDLLGEFFKRYQCLLTGSHQWALEPVIQGDWQAPFRQPLFAPRPK